MKTIKKVTLSILLLSTALSIGIAVPAQAGWHTKFKHTVESVPTVPKEDSYKKAQDAYQAEQETKRKQLGSNYSTCMEAVSSVSDLARIRAAHAQSCQCLLDGKTGVVSPAGDFMGCR